MKQYQRIALTLLAVVGLGAGVAGATYLYTVNRGLDRARGMVEHELWEYARKELDPYLWLNPNDAEARVLIAETFVKDESLKPDHAVAQALAHLRVIPDDDERAVKARTAEGRILFFLVHRPAIAERSLRRALAVDPDSKDACYMLWKILDMTGRSHVAGEYFWKVYAETPLDQRVPRLREWFMSQFYPSTANPDLHNLMGLTNDPQLPSNDPEIQRFVYFQQREPDEPLTHAMVARWFQVEGRPKNAIEFLEKAADKLENEASEPMFMAALVESLIDIGDLERADAVFQQWPEPHEGYEYWVCSGLVHQTCRKDFKAALEAFRKALATDWPGPVDWRTRNRLANCLARVDDRAGAAKEREASKTIEEQMDGKRLNHLRQLLNKLDRPEDLEEFADFYDIIKCSREADEWRAGAKRMRENAKQSGAGKTSTQNQDQLSP